MALGVGYTSGAPESNEECELLSPAPITILCKGKVLKLRYDMSELPYILPKSIRNELLLEGIDEETIMSTIKVLLKYGLGKKVSIGMIDCDQIKLRELRRGKLVYYNGVQIGLITEGTFYPFLEVIGIDGNNLITPDMVFQECIKKKEAKIAKLELLKDRLRECIKVHGKPCHLAEYIALRISDSIVVLTEQSSEIGVFKKEGGVLSPVDIDQILKNLMLEDEYAIYFTLTPTNKATLLNTLRVYADRITLDETECYVTFGNTTLDICSWINNGILKDEIVSTPFFFRTKVDIDKVLEITRSIVTNKDVLDAAEEFAKGLYELSLHVREEDRANLLMSLAIIPFCTRELKKVIMLTGPTLTGKSTTLSIIETFAENMVGYVNINRNDYRREVGISDLVLKLYGIQDEISIDMFLNNLDLIKSLVGCNKVTAWRLYKGNVTFKNRATIFFTLNENIEDHLKERLSKQDYEAIMNRLVIIHYEERMSSNEAKRLLKWAKEHKEEILEWALAMARVLHKLGWNDYYGDLKAKVIDIIEKLKENGDITVVREDDYKICILKRDLTKVAKALGLRRKDLEFTSIYYSTISKDGKTVHVACVSLI